jgi:hypothetical protein
MGRSGTNNWHPLLAAGLIGFLWLWVPWGRAEETGTTPAATPVQESEEKKEGGPERPQFSGAVDILSQYVWRGIGLSRGSAVIQPSFTVSFKGFAVNVWGNLDTNERNPYGINKPNRNSAKWNETDITVSYNREIVKNLTLTGGIIYYALDSNNSLYDSFEVFGTVAYKFPWFEVGFGAYREVANLPGWFLNWYVSRSFELPLNLPGGQPYLDLQVGWTAEFSETQTAYPTKSGQDYQNLHAGYLTAALNLPVGKYVKFSPKIWYWYALNRHAAYTIRTLSWDGKHNHVLGGASLTFAF